jgi:DDE superfamily endonuclease
MLHLPRPIIKVLHPFRRLFRKPTWDHAQTLLAGTILTPGPRTVAAALRVLGLAHQPHFQTYHRVLNRATWSSRALSQILLLLLLRAFVPDDAPVVVGIDETIERRRGTKIAARGIYRDPVRSSTEHFVKTSGLRWVSMQLLAPIPWIGRVWALPFLTVLAPSERYHAARGQRHKKVHDWGRQLILQLRRWLPQRTLVVVADSTYAVIELLAACGRLACPVTMVTRLRLDAALYDPAPARTPGAVGRPRVKGARQPTLAERLVDPKTAWQAVRVCWYGGSSREVEVTSGTAVWYHSGLPPVPIRWVLIRDPQGHFEPQALLSTNLTVSAVQIVEWFVLRWQLEVTFHEGRTHLGIETQRQWSEPAIRRTTPALFGLFSLVCLFAHELLQGARLPLRQAAWYPKTAPTFADTLAFVRQHLWPSVLSSMSPETADMVKIPRPVFQHLTETLAFAS